MNLVTPGERAAVLLVKHALGALRQLLLPRARYCARNNHKLSLWSLQLWHSCIWPALWKADELGKEVARVKAAEIRLGTCQS